MIEDQNRSWKAEPDQVEIYTDYLTVTETEGASSARRYPFASDMVCVYNGRKTDAPVRIYEGQYRGVDNNSDGQLDVLFIEETESLSSNALIQTPVCSILPISRLFAVEMG